MSAKRAISIGNGWNSGTEVGATPTMVYGGYSYCMLLYTSVYLINVNRVYEPTNMTGPTLWFLKSTTPWRVCRCKGWSGFKEIEKYPNNHTG
jgi:hypothetical protein